MANLGFSGKKGILLTLGLIFVSLTILAFANVILNNSENSESRIKEFAETERMYNIETSISKSISRMKDSLDDNLIEIDYDDGRITLKTTFSNETLLNAEEIINQLNILANRTSPYVNFNIRSPLFGSSEAFSDANAFESFLINSSRFYLRHLPHMYIEFMAYPYNTIYLNGFNTSNTIAINFTYKSNTMLPINVSQHSGGVPVGCSGQSCINVSFKNYYGDELKQDTSFSLEEMNPLYILQEIFEINLTSPEWFNNVDQNRTIAFNWMDLTTLSYTEGTSEGLLITLPEVEFTGGFFESNYYSYVQTNELDESAEIELIISLKPEDSMKEGYFIDFISPPSYNISYPKLETIAENLRVHYIE